jgi:ribonuclease BN (tRNA processing enzyme)
MQVTFLGTGAAMPAPDGTRAQTGILLDGDVLVDCGSGVLPRLGERHADIDALVVTHGHTDHVADVVPLLKARWLAGAAPLTVVGPPGTHERIEGMLAPHEYLHDRVAYEVREVEPGSFRVAGRRFDAVETRHSMRCFAYRVGEFVFSGDTEADPALAAFADGAALLAHDCSFPDGVDVSNHPTPSALAEALAGTRIDRVALTHLYPHTAGREREMAATVSERFDGEVLVAEDGLTLTL